MVLKRFCSHERMRRLVVAASVAAFGAGVGVASAFVAGSSTTLHGTIGYGSFHSKAVAGTLHYAVYLPPGYAKTRTRYPVVYFLHGLPADGRAYRQIAPIAQAIEQTHRKAIVIGAQGARISDVDPEWLDHGPGEKWETATAKELVSVVDSHYRTIATRAGRLLVGISGGGYGAMLIALHNPGVYSVVESWSGYFHATNPAGTASLDLGSKEANDWASAHTLLGRLRAFVGPKRQNGYAAFYVGTNDSVFRAENERFFREIRAAGIEDVTFRLYSGAHNWSLWSRYAVSWLAAGLAEAAGPR
jgi:S-formylglutathione hydrolase FrmB